MLGHRRAHSGSYFSGFTLATAQLQDRPTTTSKARSTEKLNELQLDPYKRAHSVRDLSGQSAGFEACKIRIEEELELQVQTLLHKHPYKEVTLPTSVKFSISREASAVMSSRPKSPACRDTELLDQTLLNIRKRLVSQ